MSVGPGGTDVEDEVFIENTNNKQTKLRLSNHTKYKAEAHQKEVVYLIACLARWSFEGLAPSHQKQLLSWIPLN